MMLSSPALEKLLDELGSDEKISDVQKEWGQDVREKPLELTAMIGYLRGISLHENLALKFEGLKFAKFINEEKLTINIISLIRHTQSHTIGDEKGLKPVLPDKIIQEKVALIRNNTHNLWHLCCGHDIVHILAFALRKTIGSAGHIEPDHVERCLRLAYKQTYFMRTLLYAAIQN
jgi:hypothetical protein